MIRFTKADLAHFTALALAIATVEAGVLYVVKKAA
jgi:hypothetical protein